MPRVVMPIDNCRARVLASSRLCSGRCSDNDSGRGGRVGLLRRISMSNRRGAWYVGFIDLGISCSSVHMAGGGPISERVGEWTRLEIVPLSPFSPLNFSWNRFLTRAGKSEA